MAYVRVADPLLNSGKPGRSTDIVQMRDNQDHFDTVTRGAVVTDQDMRDHFAQDVLTTAIDATVINKWVFYTDTLSSATIQSEHRMKLHLETAGGDWAILNANTEMQRIVKTEEYIAV